MWIFLVFISQLSLRSFLAVLIYADHKQYPSELSVDSLLSCPSFIADNHNKLSTGESVPGIVNKNTIRKVVILFR